MYVADTGTVEVKEKEKTIITQALEIIRANASNGITLYKEYGYIAILESAKSNILKIIGLLYMLKNRGTIDAKDFNNIDDIAHDLILEINDYLYGGLNNDL